MIRILLFQGSRFVLAVHLEHHNHAKAGLCGERREMDVSHAVKPVCGEMEIFDMRLLAQLNDRPMTPQHRLPRLVIQGQFRQLHAFF